MPVSESQLKATKKYHAKFERICIRVPLGEKEAIEAHAAENSESVNSFVRRAISEAMERDTMKQNEKNVKHANVKRFDLY